jgi:hypothetical protein
MHKESTKAAQTDQVESESAGMAAANEMFNARPANRSHSIRAFRL